jgi:hypothetical protein
VPEILWQYSRWQAGEEGQKTRQLPYAKTTQEGMRIVTICNGYLEVWASKENFINIHRTISRLADGLPEEGFTPRLINTYCAKGAAIVVYQDEETQDWPGSDVPNLNT